MKSSGGNDGDNSLAATVVLFVAAGYLTWKDRTKRRYASSELINTEAQGQDHGNDEKTLGQAIRRQTEGDSDGLGLVNLGNTCFINATFQALASVPVFVEYVKSYNEQNISRQNVFVNEVAQMMDDLALVVNPRGTLDPSPSAAAISNGVSRFRGIDQESRRQDAAELLESITQKIEGTNKSTGKLHVLETNGARKSPFVGRTASFLKCSVCQHKRPTRYSQFIHIMLSLPEASAHGQDQRARRKSRTELPCTLNDCFEKFAESETVDDVDCYQCSLAQERATVLNAVRGLELLCDSLGIDPQHDAAQSVASDLQRYTLRASELEQLQALSTDALDRTVLSDARVHLLKRTFRKKLEISEPPSVLCIHLGRKVFSFRMNRMIKLSQRVLFPLVLNIEAYCSVEARTDGVLFDTAERNHTVLYRLRAVLVHHGNARSGHYTTYRQIGTPSSLSAKWAHVSDERTELVSVEEVLQSEAYMLFYSI